MLRREKVLLSTPEGCPAPPPCARDARNLVLGNAMLPADFKVLIKDTLRGARFAVRHSLRSTILPEVLKSTKLTTFADNVLSTLENGVINNLESTGIVDSSVRSAMADLGSLTTCRQREAFEALFQSAYYALTKTILKNGGVENAYIAEHNYATAAKKVSLDQHQSPAKFFAMITLAIIGANPIRFVDRIEPLSNQPVFLNPNSFAAFCIGLAATVYMLKPCSNPVDCFDSAVEVVTVAHPKMFSALQAVDAVETLAQLYTDFADLLP